jgi:phosphonate transport system permease protein
MNPIARARAQALAPQATRTAWRSRMVNIAWIAVGGVALVLMAIDVGFSPDRFMTGTERLGRLMSTMFPPSSGGQTVRIVRSLAETLAMAFVGTIIAALLALPLGLLGA